VPKLPLGGRAGPGMLPRMNLSLRWILVTGVLALAGCYTVPETGRSAMIMISPGEETEMGAAAFADIRAKEKISHDAAANERVRRVGQRIAEAVGNALPTAKWEFVVFDEPKTVNAFALPGGKVGVYTGLLDLATSDDELAMVMGHEIGHVTARHGAERMSQGLVAGVIGAGVGIATDDSRNRDLWRVGYGLAAAGATLAFSRSHESEADFIGLRYAAKAGYDPHAAITFWQKMAKAKDGAQPPKWLSTHPTHADRIADLQRWVPEVLPVYEEARKRYE
ncbi:MAG TPA: M48 family metallopeptidase, partial [Bacteroidia bacterium]|nr:M48 family metallopeptidase [Bacteroidia bacterium]